MTILDDYKLAARLHAGQVDKAGRPYIEHLSRVFLRVCDAGGTRDQQSAALLHDCLEDGKATVEDLERAGVTSEAIKLVLVLTKAKRTAYLDYIEIVKLNEKAVLIKRCDLEDNADPERLAELDAHTAARLRIKYESALSALNS